MVEQINTHSKKLLTMKIHLHGIRSDADTQKIGFTIPLVHIGHHVPYHKIKRLVRILLTMPFTIQGNMAVMWLVR